MAERLGTGLQNPLHRFESGSDLFSVIRLSCVIYKSPLFPGYFVLIHKLQVERLTGTKAYTTQSYEWE
jgi:hypothetical protein